MGDVVFNGECALAVAKLGRAVHDGEDVRNRPSTVRNSHSDHFTLATNEPLTTDQAKAYCDAGGWVQDSNRQGDYWWRRKNGAWQWSIERQGSGSVWRDNDPDDNYLTDPPYTLVQVPEHLVPEPAAESEVAPASAAEAKTYCEAGGEVVSKRGYTWLHRDGRLVFRSKIQPARLIRGTFAVSGPFMLVPKPDEPDESETTRDLAVLATWEEWSGTDSRPRRHNPDTDSAWPFLRKYSLSGNWETSANPGHRPWTRYVPPKRVPAPASLGDCVGGLSVRRASWGRFSINRDCTTIDQLTAADLAATDWLVTTDGGKTWFSPLGEVDA